MIERTIRRRLRKETGSALLASLMLTVLITGAGLAAMTTSSVAQNKSKNLVNQKQALYMAEAALNHANLYLHQNIAKWASYATTSPQTLIPSTSFAGVGSYTVTVKAAGTTGGAQSALLLTATGTGLNNAKKSIATVVAIESGNLQKNAFITGQSLLVSGSPIFTGASGGIHANGNLTISGKPQITTDAEASGTYTITGSFANPQPAYSGGGQPYQTINSLTASQLSGSYDYYFVYSYVYNSTYGAHYHGQVYDKYGNLQADLHDGAAWGCWTYTTYSYWWSSTDWTYYYTPFIWTATCTPPNGTYYAIGDVALSGTIGNAASPWITTILAYGSVLVTSPSLVVRPPLSTETALYKTPTQNLLFVAGKDILITGNDHQTFGYVDQNTKITYGGIMSAYEQVGISGDPSVYGYVLAQDVSNGATSYYGSNAVASNYISGKMTLTYDGKLNTGSQGNAVTKATYCPAIPGQSGQSC